MFRLTFILLAFIGIAMLVYGGPGGAPGTVATASRAIDPALLTGSRPAEARALPPDASRPASVDRLLGVEPRPASGGAEVVASVAEAGHSLQGAEVAALSTAPEGSEPPRRRDYLSVNDEVAAHAATQAERAAAIAAAADEAVRDGVAEAMADATVALVTGTRVNVRSGPSTNFGVVGQVAYGDAAEVLSANENGWVRIRIQGDGVEGYIAARFLDGSGLNN